jgi:hypothetical protein
VEAAPASCVTGTALERSGRLTITRPRTAGSALREARAAAAVRGEARLAAVAGMRTGKTPGAAASPRHPQTTPLHPTGRSGKRALRCVRIWSQL